MLDNFSSESFALSTTLSGISKFKSIAGDNNPLETDNFLPLQASSLQLSEGIKLSERNANLPHPNWVRTIGNTGFDAGYEVVVDQVGNVYTIGEFRRSVTLDGRTITSNANTGDVFVVKQNGQDGSVAWVKAIGGTRGDIGYGIAVDGNGDVYTTGYFQSTVNLGGEGNSLTSKGFADIFILKHSGENGDVIWSKSIGGTGFDGGFAISVDDNGHVYTTGTFNGSVDLDGDGTPEVSNGLSDAFVIKQNASDGSVVWGRKIGGTGYDYGYGVTVDGSGNVYVTGEFQGAIDLNGDGTIDLRSAGETDGFIVKYNLSGDVVWSRQIGGRGFDYSYDIAVDTRGDVYVTGSFDGSVDWFGNRNFTNSQGQDDVFVAKYRGGDGSLVWVTPMGGTASEGGYAIALDSYGNVYTTGYFEGTVDFANNGNPVTNAGSSDIFVIQQNASNGKVNWVKTIGGTSVEVGVGIAVDREKNVFLTGYFQGEVDLNLDGTPEQSAGNTDGFVVKLVATVQTNTRHDFDGDGKADILWRNYTTGENAIWKLDNFAIADAAFINPPVTDGNWQIITSGDFNGDGKADILWRNISTGRNAIWLMDGLNVLGGDSQQFITSATPDWTMVSAADFDGDGKDDILWRNYNTGENAVWLMDGFQVNGQFLSIRNVGEPGWKMVAAGDVDGDGKADIIWRNQLNGKNAVWLMESAQVKQARFIETVADQSWQIKAIGDTDGDGKQDIIWQNQANGESAVWNLDTNTLDDEGKFTITGKFIEDKNSIRIRVPQGWQIENAADYNGDGRADLLWYNQSTGKTALWWMDGEVATTTEFITNGGVVVNLDGAWEVSFSPRYM